MSSWGFYDFMARQVILFPYTSLVCYTLSRWPYNHKKIREIYFFLLLLCRYPCLPCVCRRPRWIWAQFENNLLHRVHQWQVFYWPRDRMVVHQIGKNLRCAYCQRGSQQHLWPIVSSFHFEIGSHWFFIVKAAAALCVIKRLGLLPVKIDW